MVPAGLRLRKHHGLGNDFLVVVVDPSKGLTLDGSDARLLCDRHRGVGADGVFVLTPGGEGCDAAVVLYNADGSPAETSGNGLRCVGQAVLLEGLAPGPEVTVATVVGPRRLLVGPTGADGVATVTVGMGAATLGEGCDADGRPARRVDLGNPHLIVLVDDPDAVDVARVGPRLESAYPGGMNVTFAAVAGDRAAVRTWERGAGLTDACGSGSCATAVAARAWGLTGDRLEVANPGGTVSVDLSGPEVLLTGPTRAVATVVLDYPLGAP